MPALLPAIALAAAMIPAPLIHEPVHMSGYWPADGHRTLRVQLTRGVCGHALQLRTLRQGASSVRLAFGDVVAPDVVCPALAKLECRSVVLARPLGGRRVIDLTNDRPVPRLRAGDPGSAPPRSCPRIAVSR